MNDTNSTNNQAKRGRKPGLTAKTIKKLDMIKRHIDKRQGEFTTKDISNSLSLNLRDQKAPQAYISVMLSKLEQQGVVKVVEEKKEGRGRPAKVYKKV